MQLQDGGNGVVSTVDAFESELEGRGFGVFGDGERVSSFSLDIVFFPFLISGARVDGIAG